MPDVAGKEGRSVRGRGVFLLLTLESKLFLLVALFLTCIKNKIEKLLYLESIYLSQGSVANGDVTTLTQTTYIIRPLIMIPREVSPF